MDYYTDDKIFDMCGKEIIIVVEDGTDDFLYIWDQVTCRRALNVDEIKSINEKSKFTPEFAQTCRTKLKMHKLKYIQENNLDVKEYEKEILERMNVPRERKRTQKLCKLINAEVLSSIYCGLEARKKQNTELLPFLIDSYERVIEKLNADAK
ncbi:hypothetical protein RF11_15941 [Thelohanellus kitauei]|uniref:Uncharacterized protein n=1 Tax=Thelohanellus kitauei TaxID=669202 RepID=A0A0C2MXX5_THEKT|nr:hypothetical protein RF11_15941 [Thelohanellus kitauei]